MAIHFIPADADFNGQILDKVLLEAVMLLQQRYCEAMLERGDSPDEVMTKYRQTQKPIPFRPSNYATRKAGRPVKRGSEIPAFYSSRDTMMAQI